jgi:DUF1680 family protein
MNHIRTLLGLVALGLATTATAQSRLYPDHFDLQEVTLTSGPFRTAQDLGVRTLLAYDTDRLLTPYVRQAGLSATTDTRSSYYQWEERHPNFINWCWNPSFALDGHVGGHYLTALSLAYASERDESLRSQLRERIDHMVQVLADCQAAFADDTTGLKGYIGGLPDNQIWQDLYRGDPTTYQKRGGWVPFYCIHKIMAGLRDAYVYADNQEALRLLRGTCDWARDVIARFDATRRDRDILSREPGGMNEVLADASLLFNEPGYLEAARCYSHLLMIEGMQGENTATFLDNKHANTQVPKYVGFERIHELSSADSAYGSAALNFWNDVSGERTVCIGGNSIGEHFLPASRAYRYVSHAEGPETCNTNNMLKLTEELFTEQPQARYADFYEHALLNHLLSTQDPATGGYVYFTPLRPESYRIYSTVNTAMWCCVGTGMENHCKNAHFIYTHNNPQTRRAADTLYVNLFTASRLNSKKFALTQETDFPYQPSTRLTVERSGRYTLALRHPAWTTASFEVRLNGETVTTDVTPGEASYLYLNRKWRKGDVVEISLPMALRYETCPNLPDYVAFLYGPVLLGAATTSADSTAANYEALINEYADDSRMGHSLSARGRVGSLLDAPMLIGDRDALLERITVRNLDSLRFSIRCERAGGERQEVLTLQPFYTLHHVRYMIYWLRQTPEEWQINPMVQQAAVDALIEQRTIDDVAPGEQQSEAGHAMRTQGGTWCGTHNGDLFRTLSNRSSWVEYTLSTGLSAERIDTLTAKAPQLRIRFSADEGGRRLLLETAGYSCELQIPREAGQHSSDGFTEVTLPLPWSALLSPDGQGLTELTYRFSQTDKSGFPGLYHLRVITGD